MKGVKPSVGQVVKQMIKGLGVKSGSINHKYLGLVNIGRFPGVSKSLVVPVNLHKVLKIRLLVVSLGLSP